MYFSNEPRSKYLRGWLTEAETREVVGRCEEDEVTLHGLVLAAALTAMARSLLVNIENSKYFTLLRTIFLVKIIFVCYKFAKIFNLC